MKIKSAVAGVFVVATMIAAAPSQAAYRTCATCPTCSTCPQWDVPASFSGVGWHTVPCNAVLQPAVSWQQYSSGGYAPPTTRGVFLGL